MYGERPGERLLLPDRLQRADRPAGRAGRTSTSTGLLKGIYRYSPGRRTAATARGRSSSPPASAMQWALEAQQLLRRRLGRGGRRVVGDLLDRAAPRRARRRGAQPPAPRRASREVPYVTRRARRRRRPGRRVSRLHARRAGPDRAAGCPATSPRWAPTASACPTPGTRCAATSRSTPSPSWCDPAPAGPPRRGRRRRAGRGGQKYAIDDVTAAPVGETGGDS